MSCLSTSRRLVNRPILRKAGLLFMALLLAVMAWWLLFRALSSAEADSVPGRLSRVPSPPPSREGRGGGGGEVTAFTSSTPALQVAAASDDPFSLAWSSFETGAITSVAWGDYDGDGDLDLAVGKSGQNWLYRNDSGVLALAWSSAETDATKSVAWGDYDGDGDLDLAVGNGHYGSSQPNRLYRNDDGTLALVWSAPITDITTSVAWGDYDGDSDLDLVVGNGGKPNLLYRNDGGTLTRAWTAPITDSTQSVAWGDYDGDGDLDLAVGNYEQPNRLYRNDGDTLALAWSAPITDPTESVAWGDYDGDGDPDLAVGNFGVPAQPNRLYRNDGGTLTLEWSSIEMDYTQSVAWGDYDGDGDLDLAVGNYMQPSRSYRNDGGTLTLAWSSTEADDTESVAWGDYDGDGDLDLAIGNWIQPIRLYRNDGGALVLAWSAPITESIGSVAWGDYDYDGDLDLAVGNYYGEPAQRNRLYGNEGGTLTLAWTAPITDYTNSVAWGDYDGDGDLDLAVGNGVFHSDQPNRLYRNDGGTLTLAWSSTEEGRASSVAWGDYDGDSDLDLAIGNRIGMNLLYRNDGGTLTLAWSSIETDWTTSVAWGDYDGDGDLDLVAGNWGQPIRLYRNDGGSLTLAWSSAESDWTASVAWGDYDGDGDLDLSVGNDGQNRLYRNDGGTLRLAWSFTETDDTEGVAWGDYDGDGDLDLAIGNWNRPNQLYRNDGGTLRLAWSSIETDWTTSVAWGDYDGDGDLDLSVANSERQASRLYRNGRDGRSLPGSLPVVYVTRPGPNADFFSTPRIRSGPVIPITYTLSDPQGDPVKSIRAWYSPDGGGRWLPAVAAAGTITENLATTATYVYDWDVFASGFFGQSDNVAFRIWAVPAIVSTPNATPGPYLYGAYASQTFPFRVRGTQVQVYSQTVTSGNEAAGAVVYRLPEGQPTGGSPFADSSGTPFRTDQQGYLQGRGEIGLGDRLFAMLPVHRALNYAGAIVFDGVDDYVIRNPLNNAPITETTVSFWISTTQTIGGTPFSYASPRTNDIFLIAAPDNLAVHRGDGVSVTTGVTATDGVWHHIAVTWRASGGDLKLYKDGAVAYSSTLAAGTVISPGGSLMLGKNQNKDGLFEGSLDEVCMWNTVLTETQIQDILFEPPRGNEAGLVLCWDFDDPSIASSGWCEDQSPNDNDGTLVGPAWIGDYLGGYTVYHTSGTPTEDGVDTHTVISPGVQVLIVTAQHPLILFDVDLSLEWDAGNDPVYLRQLEIDLRRASKHLYDFTDGQVAIGQVTVHQNADDWATSHVAVHATNRLRPFAAQGGFVISPTLDPEHGDIIYGPGQVHMGATWNRYGTPGQNQGIDWPLILAHELSHYLLYLDDVYLGLNEDGLLIPVGTCTESAMGDVYDPANTEFIHDDVHWIVNCADTLAARTLERDEWETIELWYPWLVTPVVTNTGPSRMPFDFTTVTIRDPVSATDVLEDPTFYLDYAGDAVSSSEARAYLLRDADAADFPSVDGFEYVYDLGSPTGGQNRLLARGAQPGDRLCVFDRPQTQYGCEVIQDGDDHLALEKNETWTPVVQLSPINSTTFGIRVSGLVSEDLSLKARLYPEYGPAFTVTALSHVSVTENYSGTLDLAYPSMTGHVQVWTDEGGEPTETDPRPETIVAYAIGGNPGITRGSGGITRGSGGITRGSGGITRGSGGITRGSGGITRGSGGITRGSGAPLVSPDGQMIFFTENPLVFNEGEFFTVQSMAGLPPLPPGRTPVGQGYNLVASPNITRVITGSISIQYLDSDVLVAGVNEGDLSFYFWDGDEWAALDTVLDTYYNLATTPSQGEGVYALMASVKIPLHGPGWNLVSYPLPGSQAVTDALRSISGTYAIVYGYVVTDTSDPWRVYGVGAPPYVNRLHELRFGQGYWISVTEPITWYLSEGPDPLAAGDVQSPQSLQDMQGPPATYYGPVLTGQGFTPTVGMAVTAWIAGNLCGQGRTMEVGGEVVYSIHVSADGLGGAAGCGEPSRYVMFKVDSRAMSPTAVWGNNRLWELPLQPGWRVYLPLVLRH